MDTTEPNKGLLTVGELVDFLSTLDRDMPVMRGDSEWVSMGVTDGVVLRKGTTSPNGWVRATQVRSLKGIPACDGDSGWYALVDTDFNATVDTVLLLD